MTDEELVRQLITSVKAKVAPRAVLLESRIASALAYLDQTDSAHTPLADHLHWHLEGEYDTMPFDDPAATLRELLPKHVLLDVGTRVLVSDLEWNEQTRKPERTNPQPGRISGYDMSKSKYRWRFEFSPGRYTEVDSWAFADNRVEVHPDGPKCPPPPQPVKREPTGPRIYVEDQRGKQGYVVDTGTVNEEGSLRLLVQWFAPGARPVWKQVEMLTIIAAEDVERCPSGQTRDECGSGENQCELCLADEDNEADAIEGSMNV